MVLQLPNGSFESINLEVLVRRKWRHAMDEPQALIPNVGGDRLEFLINIMILSTTIIHIPYVMKQVERYQWKVERNREIERHKLCINKMNQ